MAGHGNDLVVTRAQAVRLLGLSGRTFDRLVQEGVLVALTKGAGRRPGTFDAPALVAAWVAYRERRSGYLDLQQEKARLAREQADKAARDNARARGELRAVAEFEAAESEIADAVRESVLGIAAEAVSEGLVPVSREAELDALVRRALRAIGEKGTDHVAA